MQLDQIRQEDNVQANYKAYLTDESGIIDQGQAERIFFPKSIDELSQIIKYAHEYDQPVTISGGGTGIAGGRVPLSGWIIATDDMCTIDRPSENWTDPESGKTYEYHLNERSSDRAEITVPIAMTVKSIQNLCRKIEWFYPPDPTERTAFIGGNIATNASGARSFKFGVTRNWVKSIEVILPNGECIHLDRNGDDHEITDQSIILRNNNEEIIVPRPRYDLPDTDKNVAGPVITSESQPIDLFIGTGGLFGVIAEATLYINKPPHSMVSIFLFTDTKEKALEVIQLAQHQRSTNSQPIPMSVEYLGPRAVSIMREVDASIPDTAESLVILEQDAQSEDEMFVYLEFWWNKIEELNILETLVAQDHQEIEHHKYLRHRVPEQVNATVKSYGQAKLGTDFAVPHNKFPELFQKVFSIGDTFESFQKQRKPLNDKIGYAFWAHAGDSHIHLNLLPRDNEEDQYAKKLVMDLIETIVEWNGSIAAEHGLGKKHFDGKPALIYQYAEAGLRDIEAMKQAIDPKSILNRGNLIDHE